MTVKNKRNSFTRCFTEVQLIIMHIGINKFVNSMKGMDTSSIPKCKGPHEVEVELKSIQLSVILSWKEELSEIKLQIIKFIHNVIKEDNKPIDFRTLWLFLGVIVKRAIGIIILKATVVNIRWKVVRSKLKGN